MLYITIYVLIYNSFIFFLTMLLIFVNIIIFLYFKHEEDLLNSKYCSNIIPFKRRIMEINLGKELL